MQYYNLYFRKLPSEFKKNVSSTVKRKCNFTYERDILLLPASYRTSKNKSKVIIPRSRDMLADNSLIGKIVLESSMSEEEIFDEIRSVFKEAMGNKSDFDFTILQHTGGKSKTLTILAVTDNYTWTAASVAGKNAKAPIYILANENLIVC